MTEETTETKVIEYQAFGSDEKVKLTLKLIGDILATPTKSGHKPTTADCYKFAMLCRARGLNPFEGDAFLIGYETKDGDKWQLITSHQAFLKRAELNPDYDGMESGVVIEQNGVTTEMPGDYFPPGATLLGGWARIHLKSRKIPMYKRIDLRRYQKPFGVWQENPAGMIVKCFDEETEILTTNGFRLFAEIDAPILQVRAHGLEPVNAEPFWQPYGGTMVTWNSRNGNFCVTPNHDMPLSINGQPEKVVEAKWLSEMKRRDVAVMPMTISSSGPDCALTDSEITLLAAYLADGSDCSSGGFAIKVSRDDKIRMLDNIGMFHSRTVRRCAGQNAISSSGRTITTRCDQIVYYYKKAMRGFCPTKKALSATALLAFSQRQAKLLVDTWLAFDGDAPRTMHLGRLYTSNQNHVGTFEIASVIAGYSVSEPQYRKSDIGGPNACISVTDRQAIALQQPLISVAPNEGFGVWCVTVPSHRIIVRRHGFSHVCYQCVEADALRSAFPTKCGGLYMREELERIGAGGEPHHQVAMDGGNLDIPTNIPEPKPLKRGRPSKEKSDSSGEAQRSYGEIKEEWTAKGIFMPAVPFTTGTTNRGETVVIQTPEPAEASPEASPRQDKSEPDEKEKKRVALVEILENKQEWKPTTFKKALTRLGLSADWRQASLEKLTELDAAVPGGA